MLYSYSILHLLLKHENCGEMNDDFLTASRVLGWMFFSSKSLEKHCMRGFYHNSYREWEEGDQLRAAGQENHVNNDAKGALKHPTLGEKCHN